jgi:anti-sigma regulatory factor (Ser/Thr protein kinase)
MFGFPRLMQLMENPAGADKLIDLLLEELDRFRGREAEQEDDITLVALTRSASTAPAFSESETNIASSAKDEHPSGRVLADFTIASEDGNERLVMKRVAEAIAELDLPSRRLERLKTAVAEATMNAIEHGNQSQPELEVAVRVVATESEVRVQITDQGGQGPIAEAEAPDLEAKLEGLQTPRGWGLFLIKNMVDDMQVTADNRHHTVELMMNRKGDDDGN